MEKDLLLQEFDQEMATTRRLLERVPNAPTFVPHNKSTPLGELAMHVATLPSLGDLVLTQPGLDVAGPNGRPPRIPFEGRDQLLRIFDEQVPVTRASLAASTDQSMRDGWSLTAGPNILMTTPRYSMYRQLFINHLVHHRAQLGVYLRMNDVPLPMTYGPSADETPSFS